jgi:hypothetical protein
MSQGWLTKELADSLFEYREGMLFWKEDRGYCKIKGKKVGSVTKAGYFESKLNGKCFKVHRAIFVMHHGYIPEQVDHIDGNRQNNSIENLRPATPFQNKCNQAIYKSNTSGVKGVYRKNNKWATQINYNGKRKNLGTFNTIEEASEFVDLARQMVHQEFARAA